MGKVVDRRKPGGLHSVQSAAELRRRPSRAPDHELENRALIALAQEIASAPEHAMQKLADTALDLCRADSAVLGVLEERDGKRHVHWRAVAGAWAPHVDRRTPRDFSPSGTTLDRNSPLLLSHPERDFPYFAEIQPGVDEALLVPFHVGGEAIGVMWVVAHDGGPRFDAEDLRLLLDLTPFAAAAYQNLRALRASELSVSIVESSDIAIVSKTLQGVITSWNGGAEKLFGYLAQEVIGQSITLLIPSDRQDEERLILERIARGERIEHYETIRRRKDGSLVPISLTISPIKHSNGEIIGASKMARDISDRRQKQEHIALLTREVYHRSKNLLTVVQAAVHFATGETPEAVKKTIAGRISALAKTHASLEESHWRGVDIRTLVTNELAPFISRDHPRAEIVGSNLMLKSRSAQSVAVVMHELTTNAVKYGALSAGAGHLRVEWSEAGDGRLVILWTESRGPPVSRPSRRGFGTSAIDQIIKVELNGDVRLDWHPEGLVCELRLDPAKEF